MPFPRILARAASRPTLCLTAALLLSASFAAQADWNVAVGAASSNGAWSGANPDVWSPSATGATVAASEINSRLTAGTPVVINTGGGGAESGDISVNSAVTWSASELTLTAARNIAINASLNGSGTAKLYLRYGFGTGAGGYTLSNGAKINLPAGGNFSTQLDSTGLVAYTVITDLGVAGDASVAPGTMTLQGMNTGLAGNYVLGTDINASGTSTWNASVGFTAVGTDATKFTGRFDGLGHTITGLTINSPGLNVPANYYQGLFGYSTGSLSNIGLLNSSISGAAIVGALAGRSDGAISNSYADGGSVSASVHQAGGLVGQGTGSIGNSYANVSVTGTNYACCGGGVSSSVIGGLIGGALAGSNISNSYATGSVSGGAYVGGLVGQNRANISNSYATGTVTSVNSGGGFIGDQLGGTITDCYWDKVTTGRGTSSGSADSAGKTTAEMKQLATFAAWDIDDAGGTGKVWRIYDTHTYPLLRNFFTASLTATAGSGGKTYDGSTANSLSVTYSATPGSHLLGTASVVVTSAAVGIQTSRVAGIYSDQTGYDIDFVAGSFTIAAVPVYDSIYAPSGGTTTLTGATPVSAAPGSTLIIPAGTEAAGAVITLLTESGASSTSVTIKIGGNTLTVAMVGNNAALTLKSVTVGGVKTLVLALSSGKVAVSAGPGQPVLMYINGGVITAGSNGSVVNQAMNGDGTATLSVTTGYVILPANAFAAIQDNKLYAGELAQIGSDGKVTQVRLGSLSGLDGAVGDPLTLKADPRRQMPTVLNLNGKLGRLGEQTPLAAIAAALGQPSLAQSGDGALGPGIAAVAVGADVDTSRADGITRSGGVTEVAISGVVFRLVPSVNDFAAFLAAIDPAASATLDADGLLSLVAKGRQYAGRASLALQAASGADGFSQDAADNLVWTRAGQTQTLYPALRIPEKLRAELVALAPQATLSDDGDGNYTISLNGQTYTLRPDFRLLNLFDFPAQHAKDGWWLDGAKVFLNYGNVTAQGMTVK